MADILYPTGCKPLTEDLGTDELIRRLKTLANVLQTMDQDERICPQYIPLALHLLDDYFVQHMSRDVQLLIACCIADVLRIFAPEAPYKEPEQIKTIFIFFIKQLNGLKDPKDPSFKRYFYLLENLAFVKSFNMCFELEDNQEIIMQLFSALFKIINEEHSVKVKNFMLDVLSPLITEADNLTVELLDLLLINIVEPHKSQNKHTYHLAEQLVIRTGDALEPTIKMFFNQAFVLDKVNNKLAISAKMYDVIYELNQINGSVLRSVLPQLESKLQSTAESERLKATTLLARMFSEKNSQLSKKYQPLMRTFLGRFCDIAVSVRVKCVQSSMHFLLNQPHLRQDITDCLRKRNHDPDETVRHEVVMAIVETAKREFEIIAESHELLDIVRERTLDKKYRIRRDAMNGLAYIYKQAICEPNNLSNEVKKSVDWIKNKILHGYYKPGLEDRLLVERLLITCLVPYKLPPQMRMKKLYHLLGDLDTHATKAFIELQKNQMKTRNTVSDWIKLHHSKEFTPKIQNQLNIKQNIICKLLPDPLKAAEYLTQFSTNMRKDSTLLRCMDIILKRDVSCKECADTMSALLKKLGSHVMTNLYYHTVKMLIERIASVMIDRESIVVLIGLIEKCMVGGNMHEEIGIPQAQAGEMGLKLLTMLSYVFSPHFFSDNSMRHLVALLSYEKPYAAPLILKILTHLGRYKPLSDTNLPLLEKLAPICKEYALTGTVKEAKHAVRCIYVNSQPSTLVDGGGGVGASTTTTTVHPIFPELIEILRTDLMPDCEAQHTKIVALGHIAYNMPTAFVSQIKNMIARCIVKDLLIQGVPEDRGFELPIGNGDWCAEENLPPDTRCKVDSLKTMARWLLGLRDDEHAAQKTFRMLDAFVDQRGDLLGENRLCGAEKAWLRLRAGCAMLKVCEQKGVGDQYNAEQFLHLSRLMIDPVREVREIFVRKLHKGLGKSLPRNCLPLDFMGYYALVGYETDRKIIELVRHFAEADVNRRREYLKTVSITSAPDSSTDGQSQYILPDYMLAFAIPVLVHNSNFTNYEDRAQLRKVEKCLRFILEPLMAKREAFVYSFYKNLIEMIKNSENVQTNAADPNANNLKMWAACDLAMYIISSKIGQADTDKNTFAMPIQLPTMFYRPSPNNGFQNTRIYIPLDTYTLGAKPSSRAAGCSSQKRTSEPPLFDDASQESPMFDDMEDDDVVEINPPQNKRTRNAMADTN